MHRKRIILLTILVLLSVAYLYHREDPTAVWRRPATDDSSRPSNSQGRSPITRSSPLLETSSPAPDSSSMDTAIENELVLLFATDGELEAFLAAAEKAGLANVDVNRSLGAVRLRFKSASDSELARSLAGEQTLLEENHTVLLPFPVVGDPNYTGAGFQDTALAYLGVPADNSHWGEGVTVALLDTGVQAHATLEATRIQHMDLVETDDTSPFSPHGTAVASLIAGQNGIAPKSEILSIRVLDSDGIGDSFTLAKGITEAVDRKADVINLSLGTYGNSELLQKAIQYASDNGVAVVAATGNEGLGLLPYPAQYDNVIAVSSIDADGAHALFANQGAAVDLAAPGVGVYAAWEEEQWVSFTGTSASAPFVAGSIAALRSLQSELTNLEAADRLASNANDLGFPGADAQTGLGVIDLQRALRVDQADIVDVALADIHIEPNANNTGESLIYVTAQNRGTVPINAPKVEIIVGQGSPRSIDLGPLGPGEIAYHSFTLFPPALRDSESNIEAVVTTRQQTDLNPVNNRKVRRVQKDEE